METKNIYSELYTDANKKTDFLIENLFGGFSLTYGFVLVSMLESFKSLHFYWRIKTEQNLLDLPHPFEDGLVRCS